MDITTAIAEPKPSVSTGKVWLDAALGLIYPEICQICGEEPARITDGYVGVRCSGAIEWIERPFCRQCGLPFDGEITGEFTCEKCRNTHWFFDSAHAAVVARGVAMEIIHRYKYEHALWFEQALARYLAQKAVPWFQERAIDWIVPVPLHPVKEREREFNQAERLARRLGQIVGVPLHTRWLQRVKFTDTQTLLTRARREQNMRNAFSVTPDAILDGLRVVLVDDVFTTGATVNSCARALMRAGAASVSVWTVGRAVL